MSFSRYITDPVKTAFAYLRQATSPLASFACSLYDVESLNHMQQALHMVVRVPRFLTHAKKTRELMRLSVFTNVISYALPMLFYRRGMNLLQDRLPDQLVPMFLKMDYLILVTLATRLSLLRFIDNLFFVLSLSKTVSQDILENIPQELSRLLAQNLARIFNDSFLKNSGGVKQLQTQIELKFGSIFKKFFVDNIFSEEAFIKFSKELEISLMAFIEECDTSRLPAEFTRDVSSCLAKCIITVLAQEFSLRTQTVLQQEMIFLQKTLSTQCAKKQVPQLVEAIMGAIVRSVSAVKSFLPLKQLAPCQCGALALARAALSTPLCHIGNMLWVALPGMLNNRGWFLPDSYQIIFPLLLVMKCMVLGQSLDAEYKTVGHCTDHRYREYSRNKTYSITVGAVYVLGAEMFAKMLQVYGGVDDFFTPDAMAQIMMQLVIINTLAHRGDSLPGKKQNAWDLFSLPRKMTLSIAKTAHELLFVVQKEKKESREKSYENFKRQLSSPYVLKTMKWLFSGNDFFPGFPRNTDKIDLLKVLIHRPSIEHFVKLSGDSLLPAVPFVEYVRDVSHWASYPILFIPSTMVSPLIVMPVLFLKEKALESFLKELELQLIHINIHAKAEFRAHVSPTTGMLEIYEAPEEVRSLIGATPLANVESERRRVQRELADALSARLGPYSREPLSSDVLQLTSEIPNYFNSDAPPQRRAPSPLSDHGEEGDLADDDLYELARVSDAPAALFGRHSSRRALRVEEDSGLENQYELTTFLR